MEDQNNFRVRCSCTDAILKTANKKKERIQCRDNLVLPDYQKAFERVCRETL